MHQFDRKITLGRLLALLCLFSLLLVSFAAPVHKHDATHEGACVFCHATQRASVVAIAADAGKPLDAAVFEIAFSDPAHKLPDAPEVRYIPRAPPFSLLAD